MHTFGLVLIFYGILCFILIVTRLPLAYNSAKVKAMIKMMGKKGFDIFFFVWACLTLGLGILFVSIY